MYVEHDESEAVERETSIFERASFVTLLATVFLVPLVFIPTAYAPVDMAKTIVITLGTLISGVLYLVHAMKSRELSLPKGPAVVAALCVIGSLVVSSIFSLDITKSVFGQGFELGVASTLGALFGIVLLVTLLSARHRERVVYFYGAVLAAFAVLALFHGVRFMAGVQMFDFGMFSAMTSSFVGTWNNVAIYASVAAILSFLGLRFLALGKGLKTLLLLCCVAALGFIVLVNFRSVWLALGLTFLVAVIFEYWRAGSNGSGVSAIIRRLSWFPLVLCIAALVLSWKGGTILGPVIERLNLAHAEVGLPWQLTLDITSDTVKESPLFGAGPNMFGPYYLKYKPEIMNATQFWDIEFNNGFSLIATFFVTQGLLGGLFWLAFIVFIIRAGVKALRNADDELSYFLVASAFFSTLFLWIMSLIYVPSHALLFLTFLMTGILFSMTTFQTLTLGPRAFRASVAGGCIVILVWGFFYVKKTVALAYFQSGLSALQSQNATTAERDFRTASFLDEDDIYYQALSEMHILKITALARQLEAGEISNADGVAEIARLVEQAVGYTRRAVEIDPWNYYNYIAEARISEVALSLKIPNAYENATAAYMNALKYDPRNPALYLNLARIEMSQNKSAEAGQLIGAALRLKQDYVDAIFLLSQLQVSQGKVQEAITSVQAAAQLHPESPIVFFQLGLLYYNNRSYRLAAEALNKAVTLNDSYANARYFLGLAEARLGNTGAARIQFEKLAETNPDNEEVVLILSNLKAGRSPFASAEPPIDSTPEQRKSLPIAE